MSRLRRTDKDKAKPVAFVGMVLADRSNYHSDQTEKVRLQLMDSLSKEQLAEFIEQAAEKAAAKAIQEWKQEEYQATMKKRKRGIHNEQGKKLSEH